MKKKLAKIGLNILKVLVSAGAIWWVISKISLGEVVGAISTANGWMLAAAGLFLFISLVFSAFRQNLSFLHTGAELSQMLNMKLFWLGMFYNLFLPGGIGGDGYKVYLVTKYRKNSLKSNIGTMLVNRIAGLVAIGMITIVLYYLSHLIIPLGSLSWVGIPLLYGAYLLVLNYFFKSFLPIHAGLFWWSLALQLMQLVSAVFILAAIHQTTNLPDYLLLFFISAIATALPITIGGIGAREMVFLIGAKMLNLDNEYCIALSLLFYLLSAALSLVGIYWVFFPPFRREDEPNEHLTDSPERLN